MQDLVTDLQHIEYVKNTRCHFWIRLQKTTELILAYSLFPFALLILMESAANWEFLYGISQMAKNSGKILTNSLWETETLI